MSNNNVFGYSLTYALQNYEKFQQLTPPEQATLLQNAKKFENHYRAHFLSPEELAKELGGSPATWRDFLTLKPVKDYIQRKTEEDTEIMNRQSLFMQALKAINSGDNQAAKYLQQLVEANAAQTNQQTVILHYIGRPTHDSSSVPDADQPSDIK